MSDNNIFPYVYANEAEQYSYYRIPKVLFTDAKVLCGLMIDCVGLSVKKGWKDADNRVYIYFTIEDIMEQLCWGYGV